MRSIDLGCGSAKVPNTIGVEIVPLPGVDVIADLTQYPYPFADNSFDKIYLNDVIEHLPDTIKSMEELYRICRPDAHVYIRVINWNSSYNADDPQHIKTFSENTFNFFGTYKDRRYYSQARFDVIEVKKEYSVQAQRLFRSKKLMKFLSRYLNNILETLHFDLMAKKNVPTFNQTIPDEDSILSYLRCPHCIGLQKQTTQNNLVQKRNWLICPNTSCRRKYPIYNNIAVMTLSEGSRWIQTQIDQLPTQVPQSFYKKI